MLPPMRRLALLAVLAVTASCFQPRDPDPSARGVLLIVIESLRADHLSCYGYDRATSKALDALAREGVRFESAYSAAPSVLPSCLALLTGCDPLVSRRYVPPGMSVSPVTMWHLDEEAPNLAHELLRQGYETAAFVDNASIGPAFGFARGFRDFEAHDEEEAGGPNEVGATALIGRFRHWLDERGPSSKWFALVELADLERTWTESDPAWDTRFARRPELDHVPPTADSNRIFHAVPRPKWSGGLRTLGEYEAEYDGAIAKLDDTLGRLFDELRQSGRLESTTVCVVASQGLGFGEAGLYLDSGMLADCDLRVPWILVPREGVDVLRGSVVEPVASLADVAPTLLAIEGVPVPPQMQGFSALAAARERGARIRDFAFADCGYQEGFAVIDERRCYERTEPWKALDSTLVMSWFGESNPPQAGVREVLHDRRADPSVGHSRSAALDEAVTAPLRDAARRWFEQAESLRRRLHPPDWLQADSASRASVDKD
jgi:arylsulfatase A-like enzyme